MNKGVAQGSVIGPMVCNVIIMNALYGDNTQKTENLFHSMPVTTGTMTRANKYGVQRNVYRHIITYADDITITTTNARELEYILEKAKTCMENAGLRISSEKTKVITLGDEKKIKFDYLGFTFLYVPKRLIKKGGHLTRNDVITERKFSVKGDGTILVYPSRKNFANIKQKTIKIIRKLTKTDILTVLNEINPILRG